MFVGEAPGYHEDRQGIPFVGQAGQLLTSLIEGIGLGRDDVFIANVLKCRPPGNRDPLPGEISSCEPHLFRQISLIRPTLVCTLGNFATKLLSGRPEGISRVHGHELPLVIAGEPVLLYPLFHPAAALYTRAMLSTLQADFARIPGLLAAGPGERPPHVPELAAVGAAPAAPAGPEPAEPPVEQLGLF
jgi:DNA polymerase